jgi:hypothetical protein
MPENAMHGLGLVISFLTLANILGVHSSLREINIPCRLRSREGERERERE